LRRFFVRLPDDKMTAAHQRRSKAARISRFANARQFLKPNG
jgi:hypothetical protein